MRPRPTWFERLHAARRETRKALDRLFGADRARPIDLCENPDGTFSARTPSNHTDKE